jgi:hypothetical protein
MLTTRIRLILGFPLILLAGLVAGVVGVLAARREGE